jgi:copper chaperone NosL
MKQLPRLLMFAAAIALIALFAFPMWSITLIAPQYPDGVTMHIWINKLGGNEPAVLQNINILNHYVGMKYIEPESIPELRYFPYIIMAMIGLGLLFAWLNKRWLFLTWTVLLVLLAVAGLYDFYLWEYDYGHSLSDTAPIKIPGASFQPPLFGTKQIISFTAISLPHIAAYFAGASIFLSALAWWLFPGRSGKKAGQLDETVKETETLDTKSSTKVTKMTAGIMAFLMLMMMSCQPSPKAISYGSDNCTFCKMTVVDAQHAAEVVTDKGKVYMFDAIECMVNYIDQNREKEYAFYLVNDFQSPKALIDAQASFYLISKAIPSPMGAFLSAFETEEEALKMKSEKGGTVYDWKGLKDQLKTAGNVRMSENMN